MRVVNVHERVLDAPVSEVGALLDTLSSPSDGLWPEQWPRMRLAGPLRVGAMGGHGPIRYVVEQYERGRSVEFRFMAPEGFHGTHGYYADPIAEDRTRLRHVLEMRTRRWAMLSWPLVYRPLHDALIEDSLDRAERTLGVGPARRPGWSWYVRLLRSAMSRLRRS